MGGLEAASLTRDVEAPPSPPCAGSAVWERLWRQVPADEKDDARLALESSSPRWALIADRLQSIFGTLRGLRTLELGSGRGDASVLLARAGAEVTLFDRSEAVLDQARRRFDRLGLTARYDCADMLGSLTRWRGGYDVALSLGVVEHFEADVRTAAVGAHGEVLRPGGVAVISVPHARCLPYRVWKFYLERRGWWPYGVECPYSKAELLRRAAAAGLVQTEAVCLNFLESVGNHWVKRLSGRAPSWTYRPSRLDPWMGLILLMFGRRPAAPLAPGE